MLTTGLMLAVDEPAGDIPLDGTQINLTSGGLPLILHTVQIVAVADDPAAIRPYYIAPQVTDEAGG